DRRSVGAEAAGAAAEIELPRAGAERGVEIVVGLDRATGEGNVVRGLERDIGQPQRAAGDGGGAGVGRGGGEDEGAGADLIDAVAVALVAEDADGERPGATEVAGGGGEGDGTGVAAARADDERPGRVVPADDDRLG